MSTKVVLITGCSAGGIGFALCEEFAEQGFKVYATSRRLETMQGFKHPNIEKFALDVTSDDDVKRVIQKIEDIEGRIDVVVNNAGALCIGPLIDVPIERVKQAFDTNTFSVLRVAKAVIPSMAKRQSGLIINISSVAADTPTPWNGIYCASKSALSSITDVLAMECSPLNIRVLLVSPGAIKSNISKNESTLFNLPPDSLYGAFIHNIIARMNASQGLHVAMPNEVFARKVVQKALLPKPPYFMTLGGYSLKFWLLTWLPRPWVLWIMWKQHTGKAR